MQPAELLRAPEPDYDIYDALIEAIEEELGLEAVFDPPPPDAPTDARPGSPEKMEVIMERVARRQRTDHPRDNRDLEGAAYDRSGNGMDVNPHAA